MDSIETRRLLIRPFQIGDLEQAHQLLDIDIQWGGPGIGREARRERLSLQIGLANWVDTGKLYGHRALALKGSGTIIGIVQFHPELWPPEWKATFWPQLFPGRYPAKEGEFPSGYGSKHASMELGIGYALGTAFRGQGYASEAVNALLEHAFRVLIVARVFAVTDRENENSVRLMQRVGMRVARNLDASVVYPGFAGVIENPNLSLENKP